MHIDDAVRLRGVETYMQAFGQALDLEHRAAAGMGRGFDNGRNIGFHAGLGQRGHDDLALGRDIGVMRHILRNAAATDGEMAANVRQASLPARWTTSAPRPKADSTVCTMPSAFRPAAAYIFSGVS